MGERKDGQREGRTEDEGSTNGRGDGLKEEGMNDGSKDGKRKEELKDG